MFLGMWLTPPPVYSVSTRGYLYKSLSLWVKHVPDDKLQSHAEALAVQHFAAENRLQYPGLCLSVLEWLGQAAKLPNPGQYCWGVLCNTTEKIFQLLPDEMQLVLSSTTVAKSSGVNLRTFIGCAVREFTFLAKKPGCKGQRISTDACWGRCETWEKPVLDRPNIEAHHRVCTYNETRMVTVKLPNCLPDVDPFYTYPVALSVSSPCYINAAMLAMQGYAAGSSEALNYLLQQALGKSHLVLGNGANSLQPIAPMTLSNPL
ncbi:UNVERIFIED_CONTAM: hypothetical protein FKN15_056638 [Acipenser sinensis]